MNAVEWAPFIVNEGVEEVKLIEYATAVQENFIQHQKGFVRRELIRKDEREYADVLYWESKADAIAASDKVMACESCKAYFELMNGDAIAGAGFGHYEPVKSWLVSS